MPTRLLLVALVAFILCLQIFPVYANDVWMHLLLGRDTLASGIPTTETYSYTAAGRPFVYHEWLGGILLYAVYALAGTTGLILLQPAAALAVAWLGLRTARSLGTDRSVAVAVVAGAIYVASFRLFVRPHLLAIPLLAAFLWLLQRHRRRGGWTGPAALAALQILWVNLHGSFPEGIVLAALFGAGELLRRRLRPASDPEPAAAISWLLLPPALLAVSLVNPYGIRLLELAFLHPVDPLFRQVIYEYLPTFSARFRETRIFWLFLGWSGLFVVSLWVGRRRLDPAHLAAAAGFAVLAVWMNRAIADFVVVSAPWVAFALGTVSRDGSVAADLPGKDGPSPGSSRWRRWRPAAVTVGLIAASGATLAFGYRFDDRSVRRFGWGIDPFTPVASADYLEREGIRGNVFCSFPHGSYLAWRLAPRMRVVFDSRMIPYGEALYREYAEARSSLEGFRRHLERYPVDAVHLAFRLDGDPALHRFLSTSPDWGLVYFDDEVLLYLRRTAATAAILDRDRMVCVHPVRFDLGGVPPDEATCWEAEARRMAERQPEAVLPRFLLAAALRTQGRAADALAELDRISAAAPPEYVGQLRSQLVDELAGQDPGRR